MPHMSAPVIGKLYAMTESDVISKLKVSFEKEPQLITPKRRTYEEYVEECKANLLKYVISPVKAKVTSACFPEYDFETYKLETVWAVARWNDNWLVTLDNKNEFALAYGDSAENLQMLGFSSSDALAEWLG